MINEDEELALAYLFDPAFEFTNTAGKPLTGGYIELYVHGTRNKYYAYSDWNGTLHPFQIPLDGLGANIVLVSPQFTYDAYIYSKYGTLQMSRYNVSPVGVGEVSVSGINEIVSNDGTVDVSQYGDTFNLSVPDITAVSGLVEDVEELNAAVTAIQEDIENLSTAVSGKKDKQEPYSFSGNARQTVTSLSQNANGNVSVGATKSVGSEYTVVHSGTTSNKFAKIAEFPCYSGFSYVGSGFTNLLVSVSDAGGARQAMISVGLTQAANGNHNFAAPLRYYVSVNQSSTMELKKVYLFSDKQYGNSQTQATISLWAEFTDLSQKQWTFKAENNYATPGTGGTPKANAWEFANGQRYAVSELPTGGWQLNSQEPMYSTQTPDWNETDSNARSYIKNKPNMANYVTQQELATAVVQSDWEQSDNTRPDYIKNKPDMSNYVTQEELVTAVSGLGVQSNWTEQDSDSPAYIQNKPDLSQFVTEQELATAVSGLGVQSDWTEQDSGSPAYIQNKPQEKDLVAGNGIDITVSGTSVIISSDNPVVTGYVTQVELASVSGALQTEISAVSGAIPDPQVNSDWNAVSGVAEILNKPETIEIETVGVSAGSGIAITEAGSGIVISCTVTGGGSTYTAGNNIDITNDVISVTDVGNLVAGSNVGITVSGSDIIISASGNGGASYTAGDNIDITNDVISVTGTSDLIAGNNITITASGSDYVISSTGGSSEIFIAIYNVTPFADVLAAYNDGKTIICKYPVTAVDDYLSCIYVGTYNQQIVKFDFSLAAGSTLDSNVSVTQASISYYTGWSVHSTILNQPVQSNWNESNSSALSYIQNKPTIHTYTAGDNIDITNDTISVTGITELVAGNAITITASGASAIISSNGEAQVQSDWDVTDSSSKAYIRNKPTIPAAQVQSNWNETNTSSKAYIQNKPTIHTYTAGDGIDITSDVVSLDDPVGLVAGNNITIEVTGVSAIISSTGGGGGTTYTAGTAIDISNQDIISVKIDGSTVTTNASGQLVANGGGTSYSAGNMISLANDTISVSTTAGITDIQVVNAASACTANNILYLIPEA